MLFTSLVYLPFLALALAVHALLPAGRRWAWLLLASYVFYGWLAPSNLLYLGGVTVLAFACGWCISQTQARSLRLTLLLAGLVVVLGLLVAAKFYDFAAGEVARLGGWVVPKLDLRGPAGLSFYVFSAVSYLVDVYAGRLPQQRHAGHVALYLGYFPKIFAGPIERATSFLPQVEHGLRPDPVRIVAGLQLVGWGLFKKVVIADNLAPMVDKTFSIAAFASPLDLLLAAYLFAFQIYCDFSGYTDIAIGTARLFGVDLMENFRRPYLAPSIREFWAQRWHISLATWFRDYLYFPLGGSLHGKIRQFVNVMVVFAVSGLWHAGLGYGVGWTFLVWGALNGAYQWVGLATAPVWRWLGGRLPRARGSRVLLVARVLVTFHLVAVSWVFFRAASIDQAWSILRRIGVNLGKLPAIVTRYPFTADHYLAAALIVLLIAIEVLDERRSLWARLAAAPTELRWAAYYAVIFALLLLGRWQAREFIYMQF